MAESSEGLNGTKCRRRLDSSLLCLMTSAEHGSTLSTPVLKCLDLDQNLHHQVPGSQALSYTTCLSGLVCRQQILTNIALKQNRHTNGHSSPWGVLRHWGTGYCCPKNNAHFTSQCNVLVLQSFFNYSHEIENEISEPINISQGHGSCRNVNSPYLY